MIQYAKSKGIALCAYVYPCLPFESMSSAWTAGRGPYTLDLSDPRVTRWMVDTMLAFVEKTGAGGFASALGRRTSIWSVITSNRFFKLR